MLPSFHAIEDYSTYFLIEEKNINSCNSQTSAEQEKTTFQDDHPHTQISTLPAFPCFPS